LKEVPAKKYGCGTPSITSGCFWLWRMKAASGITGINQASYSSRKVSHCRMVRSRRSSTAKYSPMSSRAARATERADGSNDSIMRIRRSRAGSDCSDWTMYCRRSDQSSQLCVQSSPSGWARFTLAPALESNRAVACTTLAVSSDTETNGLLSSTAMRRSPALNLGVGPIGTGAASASWPSGPATIRSATSRSSIERARGPKVPM